MATDYALPDEPKPGTLAQFALNPMWPMFTLMLIGSGAAWLWFVFNSIAQGSPFRRQEMLWIGGGVLLSFAYVFGLFTLVNSGTVPKIAIPYCLIGLTVVKLVVGYRVYLYQVRSFELFQYYSSTPVKNGALPFMLLWFVAGRLKLHEQLPVLVTLALG